MFMSKVLLSRLIAEDRPHVQKVVDYLTIRGLEVELDSSAEEINNHQINLLARGGSAKTTSVILSLIGV